MLRHSVRHAFVAVTLLVALFGQETWALAGTTGGITGYVRDTDGAPVGAARVTATAPSESTSTVTDASGRFTFLSLAPDTYTIGAEKQGYQSSATPGVVVFADQVQSVSLTMPKALKTIVSVRSQAGSLVKSGVGGDLYSVQSSQLQKSTVLGGGGNLDNAYSAIASVPGVVVGTGGMGWNQAVVVRGNNPFFTGFEYDGIPVNRAFDNYTASTASNLGLQELQVYTGGGPASISSTGTSGFINQVIKTGTYPGYASLEGGLATGAFYHQARVEAGGATPNRNFSYYVGLSGYDQAERFVDNNDGAQFNYLGSPYGLYGFTTNLTFTGQGVLNACNPFLGLADPNLPPQGCLPQLSFLYGTNDIATDRENIVNLHFGFTRHDGQRDDLQLLWSASSLKEYFGSAPYQQAGPGNLSGFMVAMTGYPYCPPMQPANAPAGCFLNSSGVASPSGAYTPNYPTYTDPYTYDLPFGTNIAGKMPQIYYQPNSPQNRTAGAPIPFDQNDLTNNDTGIVKAQWTHPLNKDSFVRLMGYTFFSDWNQSGNLASYTYLSGFAPTSPDYDLITHTAGSMLQYFNQLSDRHLLQFTANYTHANVNRWNNTGFLGGATTPIGLISNTNGVYTCYNYHNATYTYQGVPYGPGAAVPCGVRTDPFPGAPSGILPYQSSAGHVAAAGAPPPIPAGSPASAYWATLYNGNASGTFNSVVPNFYSGSLEDQWRPSDRLTINASMRFDQFSYNLAPANVGQNPFYAQIIQNYACYSPSTGTVLTKPLGPGVFPPAPIALEPTCASGYFHPNGQTPGVPAFTLNVPGNYTMKYWEPRISGTFTQNPDTVWRFSLGRYAEPPLSAAVEYLYRGGSAANLWGNFLNLGTFSPFHPIPGQTSAQYDFSLEKRIHGTQMSFKISPFYGETSNWEQQSFIGAGFVTQIPVGKARSYGIETQFNYGDFNAQGLSGLVTFTYTNSQVQFQPLLGTSQIQQEQIAINNFNAMTKAGGGAPCYSTTNVVNGVNQPDATCAATSVTNPYYNMNPVNANALLPLSGWYPQGVTALAGAGLNPSNATWFNSPYVANLVLNYRRNKLSITPSMQFQAGAAYGSPYDVVGLDPRVCGANQQTTGVVPAGSATALNCDFTQMTNVGAAPVYGYLYVPNQQTGTFAKPGQYNEPNIAMLNLQMTYDVSPKVTLQLTAADLWHRCFGGTSAPWTAAYPPNQYNCGYAANSLYLANFYNGSSPTNAGANYGVSAYPWEQQSYLPKFNNSVGGYFPFNLYLHATVKL